MGMTLQKDERYISGRPFPPSRCVNDAEQYLQASINRVIASQIQLLASA